jgi:hypothetical protein
MSGSAQLDENMMRSSFVALGILFGSTIACSSSTMVVRSDYDEAAPFDGYATFAIADEAGEFNLVGLTAAEMQVYQGVVADDLQAIAEKTITERLAKKGLTRMGEIDRADLVVTYFVNVGARPEVVAPDYGTEGGVRTGFGSQPVARGMLVVDIFDPTRLDQGQSPLVWRGWASDAIDPEGRAGRERGSQLREALQRALDRYPN